MEVNISLPLSVSLIYKGISEDLVEVEVNFEFFPLLITKEGVTFGGHTLACSRLSVYLKLRFE